MRYGSGNLMTAVLMGLIVMVTEFSIGMAAGETPVISHRDGRLEYHPEERGDRVPDFSHAGYAGGNRAIPNAPVRIVVAPADGDATARIQKALDAVGRMPSDPSGLRGAVLLLKGDYNVSGQLVLTNSGVVLRGQGAGEEGSRIVATGLGRRSLIRVTGIADRTSRTNASWRVADGYVPVGAYSFHVHDAEGLEVGDRVRVIRPSTQAWIEAIGMFHWGGEEGGVRWRPGSRDIRWDRRIESIDGTEITVDAPITTALEDQFGGGWLEACEWPGRIREVGIENLQLVSAVNPDHPKDEDHAWMGITMDNVEDAWIRRVTFRQFAGSAVALYEGCRSVTVRDCISRRPVSEDGGARRNTFFTMGQLTLFLRCHAEHGRHDFSVGHCAAGPNAFVQCDAIEAREASGPIDSWASGVLYDNVRIDGNELNLKHRGRLGQKSGWSAANSVLWQCSAAVVRCENPPTARNWAFGVWAEFEGDGIWRSANDFVSPESLYAGQLADRLGPEAAGRLQLMTPPREAATNPTIERAQELAAEAHRPAPLLADDIAHVSQRDPIPSEPGEGVLVDDLPMADAPIPSPRSSLELTNGWLTVGGKLLTGGTSGVQWWRGSIRPEEARRFGFGVTRFVPGRVGWGFTDDLDGVALVMESRNVAALDHNYGLWYERRRDDHERVRRKDGDVWPPFYEQPFARSGQGTAWDGLTRYDLTRYNPWYWTRLRDFAGVCEQRGRVLFHQNYFQHNILEAGAHWVDSPWRTANNINETGFPEPPNFAGDKRIFMAELFYDVDHPVRRELHRAYIRQCLDNFTNQPNVIQFTSAEYTGPLHFMEFWLDTIAEWESEQTHNSKSEIRAPLVALSATKDVQDAILDDPARRKLVDVIDFRYWWRTGKGEFAPPGGHNLAPRQFERKSGVGRPKDVDLAGMTAEYRSRYPDKALLAKFNDRSWAFLCAGGSIPNLPLETDEQLLRAIPRMRPWLEAITSESWGIHESGEQFLVYLGNAAALELDLRGESGDFEVFRVDPETGRIGSAEGQISGGGRVDVENWVDAVPAVLWGRRAGLENKNND